MQDGCMKKHRNFPFVLIVSTMSKSSFVQSILTLYTRHSAHVLLIAGAGPKSLIASKQANHGSTSSTPKSH